MEIKNEEIKVVFHVRKSLGTCVLQASIFKVSLVAQRDPELNKWKKRKTVDTVHEIEDFGL
jgi:hypothetical protein